MSDRELKKARRFLEKNNPAQAEALCLSLLEANPQDIEALALLASVMHMTGRVMDAMTMLDAGLALAPHHSLLHETKGRVLHSLGKKEDAMAAYTEALKGDVKNIEALNWMAGYHSEREEWAQSVGFLSHLIRYDPDNTVMKQLFCNTLSFFTIPIFNDLYKSTLTHCLRDDALDSRHILRSWIILCQADPVFEALQALEVHLDYAEFCEHIDLKALEPCLQDPFFVYGVEKLRCYSASNEFLMTNLRRYFLRLILEGKEDALLPFQEFLWALAMHCWGNEYAFFVTEEEQEQVEALRQRLEDGAMERELLLPSLYLFSCYQSPLDLETLDKVTRAVSKGRDRALSKFIKKQITGPREEAQIKPRIKQRTPISDEISKMVQSMYEENPYPRWDCVSTVSQNDVITTEAVDVLSAGCGTGQQSASYAHKYPNARFMGVDLSLSSLAYGIRQSREMGLKHLSFEHADILELDTLDQRYDHILCTGVLHHMDEPEAGLRVLKNILKPDGVMLLAFYSELARSAVVGTRDFIAAHGYTSDAQGIRQLRRDILLLTLKDDAPDFAKQITLPPDFYRLSECRDFVFHVQEYRYSIPQLLELLERQGLEFIDFKIDDRNITKAFQERFPDQGDLTDPMKWHEYEQDNPRTFGGMYSFHVKHKA